MDINDDLKQKYEQLYFNINKDNIINNILSNIFKIKNFNICNYNPNVYKNKNIVKFYINKYENKLLFYNYDKNKYIIINNINKYKLYDYNNHYYHKNQTYYENFKYNYEDYYNYTLHYTLYKYINISNIFMRFIQIEINLFNERIIEEINKIDYKNNILYKKKDNKIIKHYYTDWCYYKYYTNKYYNYNTIYTDIKEKFISIEDKNPNICKNLLLKLNNDKINLKKIYNYIKIYNYKTYSIYNKNYKIYNYFNRALNKLYNTDNNTIYIKNFYKYIKKFNSKIKYLILKLN